MDKEDIAEGRRESVSLIEKRKEDFMPTFLASFEVFKKRLNG